MDEEHTNDNPDIKEEVAIKEVAKLIAEAMTALLAATDAASTLLLDREGNWEDSDVDGLRTIAMDASETIHEGINEQLSWRNLAITFDRNYADFRLTEITR
ncbi:hypothetical protein RMS29_027385 (plasmid) [Agrobacterium rosae]